MERTLRIVVMFRDSLDETSMKPYAAFLLVDMSDFTPLDLVIVENKLTDSMRLSRPILDAWRTTRTILCSYTGN
jgi:hypothetical protein